MPMLFRLAIRALSSKSRQLLEMRFDQRWTGIALMRCRTIRTVLVALFVVAEIPSACRTERIQRAVAERAVELRRIYALMARKMRTVRMREEWICVLLRHNVTFIRYCLHKAKLIITPQHIRRTDRYCILKCNLGIGNVFLARKQFE